MHYFCRETIIGKISILAQKNSIVRMDFGDHSYQNAENIESSSIQNAFRQLIEYLTGIRQYFDLELVYDGSIFQTSVWNQLKKIPYGKTKSYREIAEAINNPKSCIAVGGACSKNPIPIFIPCHRVIGSNGKLTGYGGGIDLKKRLLEIESKTNAVQSSF
ncbi:MAG: methylated-DNA--[protein]-cysteine S-methyltransferase [Holosporaceae bacterium]|jgi:methylated-DNA-[protein]-cysteine S-methyltransferase|nr:methylated-DNA--[protein]-cysteine S-methyltransferase [Holosporaceae bacterium]